jgi:hypothetical protein
VTADRRYGREEQTEPAQPTGGSRGMLSDSTEAVSSATRATGSVHRSRETGRPCRTDASRPLHRVLDGYGLSSGCGAPLAAGGESGVSMLMVKDELVSPDASG